MFSEASFILFTGGGTPTPALRDRPTPSGGQTPLLRHTFLLEADPLWKQIQPLEADLLPLVLTSSGGHCSSRYASYWNAFLFYIEINKKNTKMTKDGGTHHTGVAVIGFLRFIAHFFTFFPVVALNWTNTTFSVILPLPPDHPRPPDRSTPPGGRPPLEAYLPLFILCIDFILSGLCLHPFLSLCEHTLLLTSQ